MLRLHIEKTPDDQDYFNEQTNEFLRLNKDYDLVMEHSLVSVSKWEAKYHKPFISVEKKTLSELQYYAECMTITQNVDPIVYFFLNNSHYDQIRAYIEDKMTATFFSDDNEESNKPSNPYQRKQIITSELIYYWMVSLEIPFDPCQKWHLNRLLTLVKVCQKKNEARQAKSSGGKHSKTSRASLANKYAAINARRRQKSGSKG